MPALVAGLLGGEGGGAPPAMVEPLLAVVGAMPGGLSEAAVRSIGRPAGQGGRHAAWQFSALAGLLAARERARTPLSIDMDKPFAGLWDSARKLVEDDSADLADRLAAASLLGHSSPRNQTDRDRLTGLIRPRVPVALQQAAVASLARQSDPGSPNSCSPAGDAIPRRSARRSSTRC